MQFLYPTFLFALAALAIPIILHLFYFRRFKKVYFTNVRFLREVKEETSARSKLRNLLVLAMRLLALLFLVLAFAQPFIPQEDVEVKQGEKAVSIFVDNSFSMSALGQEVPLLERAKQRAREIVSAYPVDDRFQILTNDFEGRHQRLVSKEDALTLIDEITTSPAVRSMDMVLTRQQQALNSESSNNQLSYLISDFQKNITDGIQGFTDTTVEVNLVPLQSVQERNIAIDTAWFDAPVQILNQTNPLLVKIRNLSNEDVDNIRLSLRYEGQTKPVGSLSIPAGESITDTVNITILRTGWHEAMLSLTDYPVQFDDNYFFTFEVAEDINVLSINADASNAYMEAAFGGIGYFALTNQQSQNLDYSGFSNYEMIVLNELRSISSGLASELQQFVENGGNLLVFPSAQAEQASYNSFLSIFPANELIAFEETARTVGTVNTSGFVFNDVFENRSANLKLPSTQANFQLSQYANRNEEELLTYRDGTPYLTKYRIGQGNLYLSAAPLSAEYNDLVNNGEIFVPMLYKMAISSGETPKIAYTIGNDEVIEANHQLSGTETVYKLQGEVEEFIPEQRVVGSKVFLGINNQIATAGFYDLFLKQDEVLGVYGFNYDRTESDLQYYNEADLQELLNPNMTIIDATVRADFEQLIGERSRGVTLWRWCLILALAFLALEVLLLRFWKV